MTANRCGVSFVGNENVKNLVITVSQPYECIKFIVLYILSGYIYLCVYVYGMVCDYNSIKLFLKCVTVLKT